MSTNKTPNLNLHSWVETDPVLMSEFNENFGAIDAASQTFGNCKIITGSYVGTGQCGSAYSNRLYFDVAPKWLIITPQSNTSYACENMHSSGYMNFNLLAIKHAIENNTNGTTYASLRGANSSNSSQAVQIYLSDEGKNIRWHTVGSEATYVSYQANSANTTYFYIAIV